MPYNKWSYFGATETEPDGVTQWTDPNGLCSAGLGHPANGGLAQSVAASPLQGEGRPFEPDSPHHTPRHILRREYHRAYQRQWMRRRREAFFAGKSCERCGSVDRLELHHRNPEEKVSHKIWSWAASRQAREIAKCSVLCRECHRYLTRLFHSSRRFALPPSPMDNVRRENNRWRVVFQIMGRSVHVGVFVDLHDAQRAAQQYRETASRHLAQLAQDFQFAEARHA